MTSHQTTDELIAVWSAHMNERVGYALAKVPTHMHGGIACYVVLGIEPGDFLAAVLRNDLMGAARNADDENRTELFEYASLMYNVFPNGSFGSPLAYRSWIEDGGLMGRFRASNSEESPA